MQYAARTQNTELKIDKPANSSLGNYIPMRNSSLEEYNYKTDIAIVKGHKRSNQGGKPSHLTMTDTLEKWEEGGSTSPGNNSRSKNTRDKLKKLTTHLGTGASRNSASKGILSASNLSSKGSKKGKYKSPKYLTQGVGSYYLKGKNTSILSR